MASEIEFKYANYEGTPPSASTTSFTLTPKTGVDIWRKPPALHVFDAPMLYKSFPISKFQRARVTVSAKWQTLYDQGGMVFIMPQANGTKKWIKTGIEFYKGQPFVSTVSADNWADWSLAETAKEKPEVLTLELERNPEEGTLWIYVVRGDDRLPIREVTWALYDPEGTAECWVGVYVGKPTASAEGVEDLVVSFKDFQLELRD
ncbi:hypothetical protein BP6252_04453 [Coleophoma cylindrospora]|uniref:DUF1349-domain-containing protein n=1 Tax=Coleophoma cylindrospora TaxID=1849047 RepID=A0A3D8S0K2_9HELO|nr:hypothetical protein BP6252_04453 [Coleophoma cylindrospora]